MIGDKADAADSPDVFIGRDIAGMWRIESLEAFDCDEITDPGDFPEFGDFVKVTELNRDRDPADDPAYLSRYVDLDRQLAEIVDEPGDTFTVSRVMEKRDGGYTMDVEPGLPE